MRFCTHDYTDFTVLRRAGTWSSDGAKSGWSFSGDLREQHSVRSRDKVPAQDHSFTKLQHYQPTRLYQFHISALQYYQETKQQTCRIPWQRFRRHIPKLYIQKDLLRLFERCAMFGKNDTTCNDYVLSLILML